MIEITFNRVASRFVGWHLVHRYGVDPFRRDERFPAGGNRSIEWKSGELPDARVTVNEPDSPGSLNLSLSEGAVALLVGDAASVMDDRLNAAAHRSRALETILAVKELNDSVRPPECGLPITAEVPGDDFGVQRPSSSDHES